MTDDLISRAYALAIATEEGAYGYISAEELTKLPSAQPKRGEWILCSEKLPDEFVSVLICFSDGSIDVAQLTDYIDIWGNPKWCHDTTHFLGGAVSSEDIVAWMPLPQSYNEVRMTDLVFPNNCEDEPQTETQTETQNSNLTFEKVMEKIQIQIIEFPDTHQEFVFTRKIEMDGDSIKIGGWEYKGVKDGERESE